MQNVVTIDNKFVLDDSILVDMKVFSTCAQHLTQRALDIRVKGANEILTSQVQQGLRTAIESYKASELPNIYLKNQSILVTNDIDEYVKFDNQTDKIIMDVDGASDLYRFSVSYLFGYAMGSKIWKYKETPLFLADMVSLLGTDDRKKIEKIVLHGYASFLEAYREVNEPLQRLILKHTYRV